MNPVKKLLEDIQNGFVLDPDGDKLTFEGNPSIEPFSLSEVESELRQSIPKDIGCFIGTFGGMRLYVDCYGLGARILHAQEIQFHNIEQQKTTQPFWPEFMIFGYSSTDDMLVLHLSDNAIKFGVLDHEAWGEPDLWASEAVTWYKFENWLSHFVQTRGEFWV